MVVPVAVPVTRSNDQGFGKRNRSNPAPRRTTPTLRTCLPRSITPPAVAGRALAIYCPHSAGSQHKYVTPMATPTARSSRIPPPASGRTAKRITRINAINAVPSFYARRLFLVATAFFSFSCLLLRVSRFHDHAPFELCTFRNGKNETKFSVDSTRR